MQIPSETGKSIRVLLVDDEIDFSSILQKRMQRRGFFVETASGGSEAIQRLRKADFHVVVLDLKMEDMDGIEVLKIFRKMVPKMPVIMLTGHGSEFSAKEGLRQGAFDYLAKPCELEDLLKKIKQAVQSTQKEE